MTITAATAVKTNTAAATAETTGSVELPATTIAAAKTEATLVALLRNKKSYKTTFKNASNLQQRRAYLNVFVTTNHHRLEVMFAMVCVHRFDLTGRISVATTQVRLPMPTL